jgi:Carbohydrate/starch-binding module (family 21)
LIDANRSVLALDVSGHAQVGTHYVHYSHDGETDLFTFEIPLPSTMEKGEPFEFIAKYEVNGTEYWDNNFGKNYIVMCAPPNSYSARET